MAVVQKAAGPALQLGRSPGRGGEAESCCYSKKEKKPYRDFLHLLHDAFRNSEAVRTELDIEMYLKVFPLKSVDPYRVCRSSGKSDNFVGPPFWSEGFSAAGRPFFAQLRPLRSPSSLQVGRGERPFKAERSCVR